jgi:predicted lipid-binding transport protein (Tim44 family)
MKNRWMAATMAFLMVIGSVGAALVPTDAEARRFGGARSQGLQRSMPAQRPATTPPSQQAQPNAPAAAAAPTAGAAAAAAAPKRSWMGPIAGLAAGLGLAALFSHLGLGAELANFMMIALMVVAAIIVVRLLMKRFGGARSAPMNQRLQPAGMGAMQQPFERRTESTTPPAPWANAAPFGAAGGSAAIAGAAPGAQTLPAGFDAQEFERIAKMIFIRMQTANDAGDLNDLRNFTTPEMFAAVRLELQERGAAQQHTDVLKVEAEVLDVAEEADRQVVSVRFHGLIREERDAAASDFDETWHLVKPNDDSRSWAIAGIQQH